MSYAFHAEYRLAIATRSGERRRLSRHTAVFAVSAAGAESLPLICAFFDAGDAATRARYGVADASADSQRVSPACPILVLRFDAEADAVILLPSLLLDIFRRRRVTPSSSDSLRRFVFATPPPSLSYHIA